MKKTILGFAFATLAVTSIVHLNKTGAFAQNNPVVQPSPTPTPVATPLPRLSIALAANLEKLQATEISRERREQAYAKLLEGQRYIWTMPRQRTKSAQDASGQLARQSFNSALELNPFLAEGYTALAELALWLPPNDIDEAISLAKIAVRLNASSYGARRILARLYTINSRLNKGTLNAEWTEKAINEWKEMAQLNPRSAESWAFLSEFYEQTGKNNELIDALENWQAATAPIETEARFYRTVMGKSEDLSPEGASLRLGAALIKVGRSGEAIEVISRAIADNPENTEAFDLLREAVENSDGAAANKAIESLQRAIFANPDNLVLTGLLAEVQSRTGNLESAVKTLQTAISKYSQTDKNSAAALQFSLGDIYADAERTSDAIAAYETALQMRGIDKTPLVEEEENEFAAQVFGKIITLYKTTNRLNEARQTIERARLVFDKDDLFADRQLISLELENGRRQEGLQAIKALRQRFPSDESLVRLEATVLTDLGKVDEGVALVKSLLKGKTSSAPSILSDDFSNYIFISMLYNQAKRTKEAIDSANLAYTAAAQNAERKQIARLSLATAQQESGNFAAAETTLREILKQTPGNPIAMNNLGYFLLERNERFDEAVKLIEGALKIDPTNPSYLDSFGWAYFKLGKFSEAEKYLKNALRRSPGSPTILEHLGDVYQKQNKMEMAKASWQKALSLATIADDINRIKAKLGGKLPK